MNLAHKKIVFLDLDGTIVGANGGVSEKVWQILEEQKSKGYLFVVCTGRTCAGVAQDIGLRFEENLDLHYAHIYDGGALGIQPHNGRVDFSFPMKKESVIALVEHSRTFDIPLELYTTEGVFADQRSVDGIRHSEVLNMPFQAADLLEINASKTVIRCHWIAREHNFEQALAIKLEGIHTARAGSPALPKMRFASITDSQVSKGDAVRRWCDLYKVDPQKTSGVGDTLGDLSMLEAVGFPFVMANADEELRCKFTNLPDIKEDGIGDLFTILDSKQR